MSWKSEKVKMIEKRVVISRMTANRRQGHGAETLQGIGAIERRGLMQLRRHGLQTGEDRDGEEGETAPDVGDTDGGDGIPAVAEEVDVRLDQRPTLEDPGDGAEDAVEQHQPGQTADRGRDDEGQQQTGPDEPAEAKRLIQHQGQTETEQAV